MLSPVKIWRNQEKIKSLLNKEGIILSFTKVSIPPSGFESQAPYLVAIVKLENGNSIIAQLIEAEDNLKIGQKVKTVLRRTKDPGTEGVIPYGIKLKPFD